MGRLTTVIALHGNGGGGFRFSLLRPDFALSTPTLPGFEGGAPLADLAGYCSYLLEQVEAVPRPRCLLGTGIGGSLILEYLQQHADTVDAVILHAPVGASLDKRWFPRLMALPGVAALVKYLIAFRPLRPLWQRLFFVAPEKIPGDFLARFFAAYGNCSAFVAMFDWLDVNWWNRLQPVHLPSALLWGARERMLKVEQVQEFRTKLPLAEVRIVPEWDHFPMVEQPQYFCREVRALLERMGL